METYTILIKTHLIWLSVTDIEAAFKVMNCVPFHLSKNVWNTMCEIWNSTTVFAISKSNRKFIPSMENGNKPRNIKKFYFAIQGALDRSINNGRKLFKLFFKYAIP